jgi:DNA repair protein RecN (Recombination protein N)
MLAKLYIENYALIQKLEVDFLSGFSVITGETGAGKSILVGALSLILGQRADTTVLQDPARKCIVEGTFNIKGYNLEDFFHENDLDFDKSAILRREIAQNGKSRAFINDTPVNLQLLKELGDRLVNIHSQHSIITLNNLDFQLAVLDNYSGHEPAVQKFRNDFNEYRKLKSELMKLEEMDLKSREDMAYQQYLLDELKKADIREGEQEELEKRLEVLTHSEEIKNGLLKSAHIISGDEVNILSMLNEIISSLNGISAFKDDIKVIVERIRSNHIDIKDLLIEIQRIEQSVAYDGDEAELVANRLDMLYRLEKKHKAGSLEELISAMHNIENKLSESSHLEDKIKHLHQQVINAEQELTLAADSISSARHKSIPGFESEITGLLVSLGIPNAQFKIECRREDILSRDGFDHIRFFFSANKGSEVNELAKIASGGELSRVMLSIKSLITRRNLLPTIIFDEIDNGVSGDIAGKVGNILRDMSAKMQVIVITHLPQIAGKGDTHYWVFKKDEKDSTRSMIKKLTQDERVKEIAKMLSNEVVTEAAFQTAKELLKN